MFECSLKVRAASDPSSRSFGLLGRYPVVCKSAAQAPRHNLVLCNCRCAFPALKPPQAFCCTGLSTLEEGLGLELAASAAEACREWLDCGSASSKPNQAAEGSPGGAPVWLVHIADSAVHCQPLATLEVSTAMLVAINVSLSHDVQSLSEAQNIAQIGHVCWGVHSS